MLRLFRVALACGPSIAAPISSSAEGTSRLDRVGARLGEDHARARHLGEGVNALGSRLSASVPQTNILQVDLSRTGRGSARWIVDPEAAGVLARPLGERGLRLVTHRHIGPEDIDGAVTAFRDRVDAA